MAAQIEEALNSVLDGASNRLPVKVANGSAGSWADAASHPQCGEGSGTPTSRLLMSGDASSLGGFVNGLLSDLEDLVDGITASDMVGAGTIDAAAAQAAAEAVQGLEDDINAELVGLGLDPIALPQTGAVIDQVLNELLGLPGWRTSSARRGSAWPSPTWKPLPIPRRWPGSTRDGWW